MLAFAPRADPTEICPNCLHDWHDRRNLVVQGAETDHLGRTCFGCPTCSETL